MAEDDVPSLSSETMDILKEFLQENSEKEFKLREITEHKNSLDVLSITFDEDWVSKHVNLHTKFTAKDSPIENILFSYFKSHKQKYFLLNRCPKIVLCFNHIRTTQF